VVSWRGGRLAASLFLWVIAAWFFALKYIASLFCGIMQTK